MQEYKTIALSIADQQILERVFSVIRQNERLVNQLVQGIEKKTWAEVAAILNQVLAWLEEDVKLTFEMARELSPTMLDVLGDLS